MGAASVAFEGGDPIRVGARPTAGSGWSRACTFLRKQQRFGGREADEVAMKQAEFNDYTGTRQTITVGDVVGVKCDVEQYAPIERIEVHFGSIKVTLRLFEGEYVDNDQGTLMTFDAHDLFLD